MGGNRNEHGLAVAQISHVPPLNFRGFFSRP